MQNSTTHFRIPHNADCHCIYQELLTIFVGQTVDYQQYDDCLQWRCFFRRQKNPVSSGSINVALNRSTYSADGSWDSFFHIFFSHSFSSFSSQNCCAFLTTSTTSGCCIQSSMIFLGNWSCCAKNLLEM